MPEVRSNADQLLRVAQGKLAGLPGAPGLWACIKQNIIVRDYMRRVAIEIWSSAQVWPRSCSHPAAPAPKSPTSASCACSSDLKGRASC